MHYFSSIIISFIFYFRACLSSRLTWRRPRGRPASLSLPAPAASPAAPRLLDRGGNRSQGPDSGLQAPHRHRSALLRYRGRWSRLVCRMDLCVVPLPMNLRHCGIRSWAAVANAYEGVGAVLRRTRVHKTRHGRPHRENRVRNTCTGTQQARRAYARREGCSDNTTYINHTSIDRTYS